MNSKDIIVSVICNTYNHEKHIAQALESFVMQKTTFPFEVLVHDDASTDGTAAIVREFELKYPKLIKPIYQSENQYSQNISITRTFQYPRALGKYFALCEGDDYWTDPYKLQKQVTAMESHPEIDICAHQTAFMRGQRISTFIPSKKENTVFSTEQVILGGSAFVSTNSLMFRREMLGSENDYTRFFCLDYIIQISGSLRGGMLYIGDCMSVYRQMNAGSWTSRMKNNFEMRMAHTAQLEDTLHKIDTGTDGRYSAAIESIISRSRLKLLARQGDLKTVLSKKYRKTLLQLPLKTRCGIIILATIKAVAKGQ